MSATADAEVRRATLIGLFAPVCWGMSVSLVRGIAEGFGMAMGQFLLYVVATVCVFLMVGLPDLRKMDKRYLFIGIPTANLSSLSFCLAIFTSTGGAQTMEVGMVNYLWPALTILFAVVFNGVRTRWWLFPGIALAFAGIVVILSGGSGFSLTGFASRFLENPLSYLLGLSAAVTWSAYSSMTKAWGGLSNPCTLIFLIDTIVFGLLWLFGVGEGPASPDLKGLLSVAFGGLAVGAAYAAWTRGMTKGNMTILAAASYFTPVLSCIFAMFWIHAELDSSFWSGVVLVVAGSLLCWDATGRGVRALQKKKAAG